MDLCSSQTNTSIGFSQPCYFRNFILSVVLLDLYQNHNSKSIAVCLAVPSRLNMYSVGLKRFQELYFFILLQTVCQTEQIANHLISLFAHSYLCDQFILTNPVYLQDQLTKDRIYFHMSCSFKQFSEQNIESLCSVESFKHKDCQSNALRLFLLSQFHS